MTDYYLTLKASNQPPRHSFVVTPLLQNEGKLFYPISKLNPSDPFLIVKPENNSLFPAGYGSVPVCYKSFAAAEVKIIVGEVIISFFKVEEEIGIGNRKSSTPSGSENRFFIPPALSFRSFIDFVRRTVNNIYHTSFAAPPFLV